MDIFNITKLVQAFGVYQATKNIRRYVISAQLVFGKKYKYTRYDVKYSAGVPAGGKLQVFNSFLELGAGRNVDGKEEYIDVIKNTNVGEVILEPSTLKAIMESVDTPVIYLKDKSFGASFMWQGRRKYFRYMPKDMYLIVKTTTNSDYFFKLKKAAEYEKSLHQYVALAQRNARALAALGLRKDLSAEQLKAFNLALTKHLYNINDFKSSLPAGVSLDLKALTPTGVQGIGLLPVIIWWVAGAVIAAVAVTKIVTDSFTEVAKQKNILNANYAAIEQIKNAAVLRNSGQLTEEQYQDIKAGADKNIETGNEALHIMTKADAEEKESGGMLGQVKQIVVVGAIVWLAKMFLDNKRSK